MGSISKMSFIQIPDLNLLELVINQLVNTRNEHCLYLLLVYKYDWFIC